MGTPAFFRALKWSVAGELISKALQPLIFIILARLLTPNDYGVVAAAIMVISFTQIFWEAGMAKAIIQRQSHVNEAANVGFWINLAMGVFFSAILFVFSDKLASLLFQDDRVGDVLKVMTIQIFLGALASVHTALLQKELKFDRLFWVRLTTIAVPGLFSIPLAWYGLSYWALVFGTLAGQAVQVVVLWKVNAWRPSFSFNLSLAKELVRFGSWVGLSGLLAWFYIWIDSFFVGSFLGVHQLGLYRTGNQFTAMIFGFLFTPLLPVLYSYFSGIQADREKLRTVFLKIIRIITLVSIPLGFLLYALSEPLSIIIFGEKWTGIGFVVGILSLMHAYSWIVGANGEIYRAMGKPSYETIVNSIALGIYLVGYYISIRQGFEIFVWTRLFLALGAVALHLAFGWIALKISVYEILKTVFVATLIGSLALAAKTGVRMFTSTNIVEIVLVGIVSGLLMLVLLFLLERHGLVMDLANLWSRRNKRSNT